MEDYVVIYSSRRKLRNKLRYKVRPKIALLVAPLVVIFLVIILHSPASQATKVPATAQSIPTRTFSAVKFSPCFVAPSRFGGSQAFECTNNSDSIHYEYIESRELMTELITNYSLISDDDQKDEGYLRVGTIDKQARLLAVDASSLLVVNLTSSDSDTKRLQTWWLNFQNAARAREPA